MSVAVSVRIVRSIGEIPRETWNGLLDGGSPFMQWDWLEALEKTGCVEEETGWVPHHLVVERSGAIVGACPMYLKLHSMGEFVFDYEWADFAHRLGIEYYPKILVGVPFTPVTGTRFIAAASEHPEMTELLGRALIEVARKNKISSVHVNFCPDEEAEALQRVGFVRRVGLQFHWENQGYASFDDYLRSFRSDRRNKIKRERRSIAERGIEIRVVEGSAVTREHLRTMFRLYKGHVDNLYYGRQYLTREFFDELGERFSSHLCLIFAERSGRVIAGTFNVVDGSALYGRYWGAFEEEPFLHFNVCYYAAIEHCIRRGFARFEAGAGGSFKQLRGLEPQPTTSMHYIVDAKFGRAVERHLAQERDLIGQKREMMLEQSQLKKHPREE
jgi:predicted N-acyltransferase